MGKSYLHFVQLAENKNYVTILPTDTRIVTCEVSKLIKDVDEIPKGKFMELLDAEAPYFMRTIMDLELPPKEDHIDRLALEVLDTAEKRDLAIANDPLKLFMESIYEVTKNDSDRISKDDVLLAYNAWCKAGKHLEISDTHKVTARLKKLFPDKIKYDQKIKAGDKWENCYTNIKAKVNI